MRTIVFDLTDGQPFDEGLLKAAIDAMASQIAKEMMSRDQDNGDHARNTAGDVAQSAG